MTTVAQIIDDAFRASNLVAVGVSPNPDEQAEALRHLSRIVKSVFGNEAGENFVNLPIGQANISRPSGYPWYGDVPEGEWFVPENVRLMANLEQAQEVFLHPDPDDGSRLAVIDVAGSFGSTPLTIKGNGRKIDGQDSVVLNTDGDNKEWFYRGDLGQWLTYGPLVLTDPFPFPEEFDEYFYTSLAMRINPLYGSALSQETVAVMNRAKSQLRARYYQKIPVPVEEALLRTSKMTADRRFFRGETGVYDPSSLFSKGWPG